MTCFQSTTFLGLTTSDWFILCIGAILGLLVTVLYQWLVSQRLRLMLHKTYAGQWVRTGMHEYRIQEGVWKQSNPHVFGKEVIITVRSPKSIHAMVDYGEGRGIAEAGIEMHGDGMTSGEGPYSYTREGDACFGNAGWYSVHRMSAGKLHVYFIGRFPENTANGYEVWERQ